MHQRVTVLVAAGMLFVAAATRAVPAGAQSTTTACRPADSRSVHYLNAMRTLATNTDAEYVATRGRLRVPNVPATQVAYVTDEKVCNKAVQAFAAAAGTRSDGVVPSGQVYVVRVGTVYVVRDPVFTLLAQSLG
jgi:hypothetical protein